MARRAKATTPKAREERAQAEFQEVARIRLNERTSVVVSRVIEDGEVKGLSVGKFVETARYTGFSGGILIPIEKAGDFAGMIETTFAVEAGAVRGKAKKAK